MNEATAILALALAAVFLTSGVSKLLALDSSATTLASLRLPVVAPRLAVGGLSVAEIAVGLGVLLWRPLLTIAAGGAVALALAFLVVVVRAYRLGSEDDCGCFGKTDSTPVSRALIVRNVVLLAVTIALLALALLGGGGVPAVVDTLFSGSFGPAVAVLAAGLVAALVWGVLQARNGSSVATATPAAPAPIAAPVNEAPEATWASAADGPLVLLSASDGRGLDIARQRGIRAQLLVFVLPGCGPCVAVDGHLTANVDALAQIVDVTTIAKFGHGDEPDFAKEAGSTLHKVTAYDLGNRVAKALGVSTSRPSAALIGADGVLVQPLATGLDEVTELIDVLVEAAAESPSEVPA